MFSLNELGTLEQLVRREQDRMYQNEVSMNHDVLINYIKHLENIKQKICEQKNRVIQAV